MLTRCQYKPDGIAQALLCDHSYTSNEKISEGQAPIIALLANKHKASSSAIEFSQVLQFWQSRLEHNMSSYESEAGELGVDIERVLSILVGAVPRQEKGLLALIPLVHMVISLPNSIGNTFARNINQVVDHDAYLQTDLHAVIRPLYKQWSYAHLVKPMYANALPVSSDNESASQGLQTSAEHNTIAILSILKNCPVAVYESDIDALVSMCLAVLQTMGAVGEIQSALEILGRILAHDAAAVKYHLRAIIKALTEVYSAKLDSRNDPFRPSKEYLLTKRTLKKKELPLAAFATARKTVLQMLGGIPARFETRYVLPFVGDMNRFLDSCCDDPVRELRRVAVETREAWFAVD